MTRCKVRTPIIINDHPSHVHSQIFRILDSVETTWHHLPFLPRDHQGMIIISKEVDLYIYSISWPARQRPPINIIKYPWLLNLKWTYDLDWFRVDPPQNDLRIFRTLGILGHYHELANHLWGWLSWRAFLFGTTHWCVTGLCQVQWLISFRCDDDVRPKRDLYVMGCQFSILAFPDWNIMKFWFDRCGSW